MIFMGVSLHDMWNWNRWDDDIYPHPSIYFVGIYTGNTELGVRMGKVFFRTHVKWSQDPNDEKWATCFFGQKTWGSRDMTYQIRTIDYIHDFQGWWHWRTGIAWGILQLLALLAMNHDFRDSMRFPLVVEWYHNLLCFFVLRELNPPFKTRTQQLLKNGAFYGIFICSPKSGDDGSLIVFSHGFQCPQCLS